MLASHAESLEDAMSGIADAEVEWKVDGMRAQVHKDGARVAVFSRQGNDITEGCTPLLGAFRALAADKAVLDGEIALVGPDGKARPFQDSFSAIASKGTAHAGDRLCAYLFDCLHRDGADLLDEPLAARIAALDAIAPAHLRIPRLRTTALADADRFRTQALEAGHEGVMVKDLASTYRFGARGGAWQKVKPFVTVDLVVLAVEHGSGRRKGLLSNLHLGARRADGTFCMVGKTFKGLTDEMLRWQTARLEQLATHREGHVVHVRPELVVEIRFNDVQRSPRYPGGVALRFARVVRYREDKTAAEIEPLEALVARSPGGGPPKKRQLSLFGD
jgi:DNA ligase-1